MYRIFTLIALIMAGTQVSAQTATVGWEDVCNYDVRDDPDAINTALIDGNTEIRVSNQNDYLSNILIEGSVKLKGGYASCEAAATDTHFGEKTRIDGTSVIPTALKIHTDGDLVDVLVSGFLIEKATGVGEDGSLFNVAAAAAIVETKGEVTLRDMVLNDNESEFWAGGLAIRYDLDLTPADSVQVNLEDVMITNNTSGSTGGGLACYRGGSSVSVYVSGQSGISYNHAEYQGGGLYNNGCRIYFSSGTSSPGPGDPRGIHGNTSNRSGAGLAMFEEGVLTLTGTQLEPVNITSNQANLDGSGRGDGGGIFLSGDFVEVVADRVMINNNETDDTGGGVFIQYGATFTMSTESRGCNWNPLCGELSHNRANSGGAIQVENGTNLTLMGFESTGNRANNGAFLIVRNDDSEVIIKSALIHHNGDTDHIDYRDAALIANQTGNSSINIYFSTIVDNAVQDQTIIGYNGTNGFLGVWRSIIDDPGVPSIGYVNPDITTGSIDCVIINDTSTLNNIPVNQVYDEAPVFVDRPNRDYHLTGPDNTAIDKCQIKDGARFYLDVDGQTRGEDIPEVVNESGSFDMGFDEYYSPDLGVIFIDGFEP